MSTEETLREHLAAADIVPLALSVVHLTGDTALLDAIAPHIHGPWDSQVRVPDELALEIRGWAAELLSRKSGPDGGGLKPGVLQRMMSVAAGEAVSDPYVGMFLEHVLPGLSAPRRKGDIPLDAARIESVGGFRAVIIGAGASGLCAAIRLGQLGISYVVLEKNEDVGGTWFDNRYPGCAVDLPSHHYEYSFERNQDWSHHYSKQPGVLAYLRRCAEKYGVRQNIRFGLEVQKATYDESKRSWSITAKTRNGALEDVQGNILIVAVGQLNLPLIPKIDGVERFRGRSFHTATWPDDLDVKGKRVALVGTGPSAVQVGPAIAESVDSLHVFQRSGNWIAKRPKISEPVSKSTIWLLHNVPYYAEWSRFRLFWAFGDSMLDAFKVDPNWTGGKDSISEVNARYRSVFVRHIERELDGRDDLLKKAVPPYPPFSRRVIADPGWYAMLRRANVKLVDAGIERISEDAIHTSDGESYPADLIVFATGFRADQMLGPLDIRGRNGRSLRSVWGIDNPRAYLGITVPDFPNLFLLYGPNSNFAHGGSAIFMAECQVNYVVDMVSLMVRNGHAAAEVRKDVHDRYNEHLDQELQKLVWSDPSTRSWYKNGKGRVVANQPWRLVDYWRLTRRARAEDYTFFRRQP